MVMSNLQKFNHQQHIEIWKQRITECRQSNMTVRKWCYQNGVSYSQYYKWQAIIFDEVGKEHSSQSCNQEFVELSAIESTTETAPAIKAAENSFLAPLDAKDLNVVAKLSVCGVTVDIYNTATARDICEIIKGIKLC